MQVSEILEMKKGIKAKLMAATSLLLVSAILLSLTTYAWFILSTAPEVTEMQTTAGANGSLEIALQSQGDNGRKEISGGVGDSASKKGQSIKIANTTWGNIVDLSSGYGLEQIGLSPARLNLDGNNVNIANPLLVPEFGQDGRITGLLKVPTLSYKEDEKNTGFEEGNTYGVKVFGNQSDLSGEKKIIQRTLNRQQLVDNTAKTILAQRTDMRKALNGMMTDPAMGTGIIGIMKTSYNALGSVDKPESASSNVYTEEDYSNMSQIYAVFEGILSKALVSLRYALLGCCAADIINYPADEAGQFALSQVYAKYATLALTGEEESVQSIAQTNFDKLSSSSDASIELKSAYEQLIDSAVKLQSAQDNLTAAKGLIKDKKMAMAVMKTFNPYSTYIAATVDGAEQCTSTWDDAKAKKMCFNIDDVTKGKKLYFSQGSGLFADVAVIAGDYAATVKATFSQTDRWGTTYYYYTLETYAFSQYKAEKNPTAADFTAAYSEENNTGCLNAVYGLVKDLHISGSVTYTVENSSRVMAYGYSVDLAFKSSGENGKLCLQQEKKDRVTGGETAADRLPEGQTTQGGGSTMSFACADDMTEEQIQALLGDVYILFMNTDTGGIYGIAAADTGEGAVKFETRYDEAVQRNKKYVTAPLTMHDLAFQDGSIRPGKEREKQDITELTKNQELYVTALVYLSGDALSASSLSADTTQSLFGSVNLQFTTDAPLTSMQPDQYYSAA